jgi:hypothetical protein
MDKKEIIRKLELADIAQIEDYAHTFANKTMLQRVYCEIFRCSEAEFEEEHERLYTQKWKEWYNNIPLEKRHRNLTEFYEEIFES